jgi:hypothetical protein
MGRHMSTRKPLSTASESVLTVAAAARALYPHEALPDGVYARVGVKLAELAREDPDAARAIAEGVSALNAEQPFTELPAQARLEILQGIEGTEFFELVRSNAVVQIYSDERTWQLCGYEGPSFDKGGYLHRGFNDLDWLPDPDGVS